MLNCIAALIERNEFPPTVRDLAIVLKIRSPNGVMSHLRPLRKKGWLDWQDGKARTLRLIGGDA